MNHRTWTWLPVMVALVVSVAVASTSAFAHARRSHSGSSAFSLAAASFLSRDTGKPLSAIDQLKAQDKSWVKVAAAVGLSASAWRQADRALKNQAAQARAYTLAGQLVLHKLTGKSDTQLDSLLQASGGSWPAVVNRLKVAHPAYVDLVIASRSVTLLEARSRGRVLAGFLAQLSGKTAKAIAALHTKGTTWLEVAKKLGY